MATATRIAQPKEQVRYFACRRDPCCHDGAMYATSDAVRQVDSVAAHSPAQQVDVTIILLGVHDEDRYTMLMTRG